MGTVADPKEGASGGRIPISLKGVTTCTLTNGLISRSKLEYTPVLRRLVGLPARAARLRPVRLAGTTRAQVYELLLPPLRRPLPAAATPAARDQAFGKSTRRAAARPGR